MLQHIAQLRAVAVEHEPPPPAASPPPSPPPSPQAGERGGYNDTSDPASEALVQSQFPRTHRSAQVRLEKDAAAAAAAAVG